MAKLILNLRNVLDEERDDVRAMLDAHDIAWYETEPSRWGISFGGIWLSEDADLPRAKALMATYQAERGTRVRAENAAAQADGSADTFADVWRREPLRVLLTGLAILALLALVALPVYLLRS